MEIKKEWFKDNFEQKFYLFCHQKEFKSGSLIEKYSEKLAQNKNIDKSTNV